MSILRDSHGIANIIHWKCYVGVHNATTVNVLNSATTALCLMTQCAWSQLRWLCPLFSHLFYSMENSKKKRVSSNTRLSISIHHILLKHSSFETTLFKPTKLKVQEIQIGQLSPNVRSTGSTYDSWFQGSHFIFLNHKKCYI